MFVIKKGGDEMMDYNITYRPKNKSIQCIVSYKLGDEWKQKGKQGFKTKKEAKPWIERTLKELEELTDNFTDGFTVDKLLERYVEDYKYSRSLRTIELTEAAVKAFPTLRNKPIEEIKKEDVQKCVNEMKKFEISTIRTRCDYMKKLFNVAINEYKLITENPFVGIIYPTKDTAKRKRRALTLEELNTLLESTTSLRKKVMVSLAGKCGMRIGEITGLNKSDIYLEQGLINIDKQWKKLRDGSHGYGKLKNKEKGERLTPISKEVKELLEQFLPKCKTERLFPYASSDSASNAFNDFLQNTMGYEITGHELRHTFATTLLANNTDVKTVAYLMGDTVEMVLKTYVHFTAEMMDNASKVINKIF